MGFSPEPQSWQQAWFQTTTYWICDGKLSPQPTVRKSRTTTHQTLRVAALHSQHSTVSFHPTQLDVSVDDGPQNHISLLMALMHSRSHTQHIYTKTYTLECIAKPKCCTCHRYVTPSRCMAWWECAPETDDSSKPFASHQSDLITSVRDKTQVY